MPKSGVVLHSEDILGVALYVEYQVATRNNISTFPRQEDGPRSIFTREDRLDLSIALVEFFATGVKEGSLLFEGGLDEIVEAWDFLIPALDLLEAAQAWIDDREYRDSRLAELVQFGGRFFELRSEVDGDTPSNVHRT